MGNMMSEVRDQCTIIERGGGRGAMQQKGLSKTLMFILYLL